MFQATLRSKAAIVFSQYIGMSAMFIIWPRLSEQNFVPLVAGDYIWNFVTIGLVVSGEKSFENVNGRTTTDKAAFPSYKLAQLSE